MTRSKQQNGAAAADLASKSVRDFVSTAAHDLREPLRAIRAHAQFLAAIPDAEKTDRRAQCVDYIHAGVDRVENLIRDIEDYWLEEIRELELCEVSLESALQEARRQVSQRLNECGGQVTYDVLPVITADFESLASVFRILIDNACKFRAVPAPRVHVTAARVRRDWVVSVVDNGQGFDPTYAELIFKPFERLNGKRYPGSGLGLPLARRIVARHRGRIWAESRPDSGSTFRFALR
ncbi:MAG TPA: ATP-binding protein [Bryobacteraceae bacterium]|jgi:light-regulated signal transduction histidine kinase (bacteriophytochrome)